MLPPHTHTFTPIKFPCVVGEKDFSQLLRVQFSNPSTACVFVGRLKPVTKVSVVYRMEINLE